MGRVIPNERSWIGILLDTGIATYDVGDPTSLTPTAAEVAAGVNVTRLVASINASEQGNTIPAPSLDSLFETTAPGTSQAQFSIEGYRDDGAGADLLWTTLEKGFQGFAVIGRFGLSGTTAAGKPLPIAGDVVEVWPIYVSSRAPGAMQSNQLQTVTITCAVPDEPNLEITVLA